MQQNGKFRSTPIYDELVERLGDPFPQQTPLIRETAAQTKRRMKKAGKQTTRASKKLAS